MTIPLACPACRSLRLAPRGIAAQALVHELQARFTDARIFELSSDTAKSPKKQVRVMHEFSQEPQGILVATQLVFSQAPPPLDLIVVSAAEQLLTISDFRTEEQFFSTIMRFRGMLQEKGRLIIQAWHPDRALLKLAVQDNWEEFAQQELALRKSLSWPPFRRIAKLTLKHPDAAKADEQSEQMLKKLKRTLITTHYSARAEILGPSSGLIARPRGKHQRIIIVKWKPKGEFDTLFEKKLAEIIPPQWDITINPSSIL